MSAIDKVGQKCPSPAMTWRTHNGDLQFLHAMRPIQQGSTAPLSSQETSELIIHWIEHVYPIAKGEVRPGIKISVYKNGYFCRFHLHQN